MDESMTAMADSRNWFDAVPPSRQRFLHAGEREGIIIHIHGNPLLNFASNDYLGLATSDALKHAAINSVQRDGTGSGASRLISGDHPLLHQLESELAQWKGYEACLVVGSGMLCNTGIIPALLNRHDHVFADKLNHASLVDGVRLSGATSHRFAHLDYNALEHRLQQHAAKHRLIVSDGVFSMDGDCADIHTLIQLAEQHDCLCLIDDAHGIGTVGEKGQGCINQAQLQGHPRLIEVGTFGKSFGSYGAFILGSHALVEGLRQRMRSFIYSTALPVPVIAASLAGLHAIQQGHCVQKLQDNLQYFKQQLQSPRLLPSDTPIQGILLGSDQAALDASGLLRDAGVFVPAIRPPTVPEHTARLRITLSAAHSFAHIDKLIRALRNIA